MLTCPTILQSSCNMGKGAVGRSDTLAFTRPLKVKWGGVGWGGWMGPPPSRLGPSGPNKGWLLN